MRNSLLTSLRREKTYAEPLTDPFGKGQDPGQVGRRTTSALADP